MDTTVQFITYGKTGAFPKIVTDYIGGSALLKPFYKHPVNLDGIKAAIKERKQYAVNRVLLVETLKKQYASVDTAAKVTANINQLGNQNTFTVTTAHQPNIFTGPLYFIYKILHAIKLAHYLNEQITDCHFVPVYYMGSEDADIEELGHLYINSEKYQWQTNQSGAVGRMKVDKALGKLIEQISGQMLVHPFGNEIISLLKNCYTEGANIEQATFKLVNELFKEYGLVVLLPDNAALKKSFIPVIEKELNEKFSYNALQKTLKDFPTEYKMQAGGREINLFWLQDGVRERIVEGNSKFKIQNLNKEFDKAAMASEVQQHPERFSPNVILRPVFQEMILPNIAFIGGGGELAYWLELKKVFEAVLIPYPVLILRNSFLVAEKKYKELSGHLHFSITDLFKPENELLTELVKRESKLQLSLQKEKEQLVLLYTQLQKISGAVNTSLAKHTAALQVTALKKIETLEKKMLRAEKKKQEASQRQLSKIKKVLFPNGSLQERIENIIPFYAKYGKAFINMLYTHSATIEQEFGIIEEA